MTRSALIKDCLITVTFIFIIAAPVRTQDPQFSQFYAAPLYLNPALAGAETYVTFNVNYRTQWSSLDFPFTVSQFSMIYPIVLNASTRRHIGGFGITAFTEGLGVNKNLKTLGAFITGAYNLELDLSGLNRITFGLQGGFVQKRIDFNSLEWGSQYDPFVGFQANAAEPTFVSALESQRLYPLFNAGVMWFLNAEKLYSGSNAYAGFSASNLNQPNESLASGKAYRLPILYKLKGGMEVFVAKKVSVSPSGIFLMQNGISQINLGTYVGYNLLDKEDNPGYIQLGLWHRLEDSFIISAGFQTKAIKVGLSFDYNSSSLRFNTGGQGAYEISLSYLISKDKELKKFSTPLI